MESEFECQSCGIVHSHVEGLDHSISGAFSKAATVMSMNLQYNPDCHCGWHELNAKIQSDKIDMDDVVAEFIEYRCERLVLPASVERDIYGD